MQSGIQYTLNVKIVITVCNLEAKVPSKSNNSRKSSNSLFRGGLAQRATGRSPGGPHVLYRWGALDYYIPSNPHWICVE